MTETVISQAELDERIAILKRLRHLLEQQREKFREYLRVLENQECVIEKEDVEGLIAHTELEESIVRSIHSIQKVISPLESLYRDISQDEAESQLPELRSELVSLQQKVLNQNKKNRQLITQHMDSLKFRMSHLKNPYDKRQSIYAKTEQNAVFVDIIQ